MMARFSRQLFARWWRRRDSAGPCPTRTGPCPTRTGPCPTRTGPSPTRTGLHTGPNGTGLHSDHTHQHTDLTDLTDLTGSAQLCSSIQDNMDYQEAVCALNTLQTNASLLDQVRRERLNPQLQLSAMRGFLQRAGLTVEQLDQLNIIHVTGTKGKGSTCAFSEQILRSYGFRTGFYSSPHLVQVRERIRINGKPISRKLFTEYFWKVFGRLEDTKEAHGGSMPAYFRFLTIMAFHVFLQEKVDVAVIEVGIGGAYDCTNIIQKPWVCGISSLGIDHTQILGDTIEKIAWQKGGIFKPGVPAFTVKQTESSMAVLRERAREIHCPLWVCPDLGQYVWDEQAQQHHLVVGLAGRHQRSNASLALQLTSAWLHRRCETDQSELCSDVEQNADSSLAQAPRFHLSPVMVQGLAETSWPGRNQTMSRGSVTYFLDGAHTMRSMQACVEWFRDTAEEHERHAVGPVARVLLFNATGDRDCAAMLKLLLPCHFDFAVFCPNISETLTSTADQQNYNVSVDNMLTRCLDNQSSWRLHTCSHQQGEPEDQQQLLIQALPSRPLMAGGGGGAQTAVFPCILSALRWISRGRDPALPGPASSSSSEGGVSPAGEAPPPLLGVASEVHVLITGSLHLVGGALKHLDPASAN